MSTDIDTDTIGLSAEEQAQFDAMRGDSPGSNASSPDQLVDPAGTAPADGVTAAADVPAAVEPAPMGEVPDDEDVETVKDATGKDVIDVKTGKPQKRVSFHKFQRLEQRYKDAEAALAKKTEESARIDERLKIINEALTTPAVDPAAAAVDEDPEPDPENNIFEHNKWLKRQLGRERTERETFQNSIREQNEEAQIANTYRQRANQFAKTEPHFGAAYHFLLTLRGNQLRAGGWDDETKIAQQIVKEEKGLVRKALQEDKNPAERLFEMAKAAGFAPKAAPVAPAPAVPAVPGTPLGEAPPAARAAVPAVAPKIPSVSEQVALAAQGAAAATSLSNAGGAAMEQLTQAKLLAMPEEEFDAVVASLPKAKLRELFGD